jgi:hypothetical protein
MKCGRRGGRLKSKSYNTTAYSFGIGPWNITRLFSTRPHVERGGMRIPNSFGHGTFQRGKVTTKQVVNEMGPDRAGLSCPGSSAVATEPPKTLHSTVLWEDRNCFIPKYDSTSKYAVMSYVLPYTGFLFAKYRASAFVLYGPICVVILAP